MTRYKYLTVALIVGFALSAGAQNLSSEVKNVEWVGFRQYQEVSRVFVRTTEPVKYRIDRSRPNVVELILENTSVSLKNNLRHLDTRHFQSPVILVQPKLVEGPSPSVHIEIHLRNEVPYKEVQTDNTLSLDFQRN